MASTHKFLILHEFPSSEVEAKWRELLTRIECPAHYDAPEYFLEPYWEGKHPFAVFAVAGDRFDGVLTGIHLPNEVVAGEISRPQVAIAQGCDTQAVAETLAQGLIAEAGSEDMVAAYAWEEPALDGFLPQGYRTRMCRGAVVLDLSTGSEALFSELSTTRRRNVRLATRNGVEVRQASDLSEMKAFYEVYCRWRVTERKEIHGDELPYSVFEHWFRFNTVNRKFFLAHYSGKIIAGTTLRVHPGGLVEYANNSSLDEFLHLRPNDLIGWKAIEWAAAAGFKRYSLGGFDRFHRDFGGSLVRVVRYRLDRSFLRRHDLRESLMDTGRETLKKLPSPIEKAVRSAVGKN